MGNAKVLGSEKQTIRYSYEYMHVFLFNSAFYFRPMFYALFYRCVLLQFEFTREEFREWVERVQSMLRTMDDDGVVDYSTSYFEVGILEAYPGGDLCGGATQGVVFQRLLSTCAPIGATARFCDEETGTATSYKEHELIWEWPL